MNDRVNRPKHYTSHPSGVECITITQFYNFCVGNAIKYVWRCGLKDEEGMDPVVKQIEDLKKAVWYLNREITNLQEGVYNGKRMQTKDQSMAQVGIRAEGKVHVSGSPETAESPYRFNDWQSGYSIRYVKGAESGARTGSSSGSSAETTRSILPSRCYLRSNN